jgi:predicted HTH transcriptional regulator
MDINVLIQQQESESVDFKQSHHTDTLALLHDILCLANAWTESDRFLVFGVADDGRVVEVETSTNRRTGADVQDLLRQSRLNRLPSVSMQTVLVSGHEVDVLTIRNRPDKPFFMTADRDYQGRTIRAGVVYTRIGDTNVPLRESATEEAIELAWRERFGLGLSPLRRAFRLLEEPDKWQKIGGEEYF